MSETSASEVTTPADTFLVIARFSMDDVVLECKRDLESARQLASVIAAEPETIYREFGESFRFWFTNQKHKPGLDDLSQIGIVRLLGGVVAVGFVEHIEVS